MARILSGADFGVQFPQNGGVANNRFGLSMAAQLLGGQLNRQSQEGIASRDLAFKQQEADQIELRSQQSAEVKMQEKRLGALSVALTGVKNMPSSTPKERSAKNAAFARIAIKEQQGGRDSSPFMPALNASSGDEMNMFIDGLIGQSEAYRGEASEWMKVNAPPEPSTDIAKAREDLNAGFITQEEFNTIKSTPEKFQTDVGKMIADRQLAIKTFGADSPQVKAFDDAIASEAAGEGPKLTDIAGIRKEFTKQSQDFIKIRDAYSRIQSASDSGPGDVSLIFGFMKLIDPGSTVREGEFATAEQTQGIPDQVANLYNKAINGERLGETARTTFKAEADNLFEAQKEAQLQLEGVFQGLATRQGMKPEDVAIDFIGDLRSIAPAVPTNTGITATEFQALTLDQKKAYLESIKQ